MKKVLFVLPSGQGGGVEINTQRLISGLAGRHQITLLLLDDSMPLVKSDIRLVNANANRLIAAIPKIVRLLRKEKFDCIVSAKDYINLFFVVCKILRISQARLIITVRGDIFSSATDAKNIIDRVTPLLCLLLYPFADSVVAVSKDLAFKVGRMIPFGRRKVRAIYNPIVSSALYTQAHEQIAHPWLTAPDDEVAPLLVTVGRLEPQKDLPTLLKAVSLARIEERLRLLIVGEGSQRNELVKMVADLGLSGIVDFVGHVDNPFPFMRAADVFVLSSIYEGLPTVLVEAIALGAKVVSTDCPTGPRELLSDGEIGHLVPMRSPQDLSDAILRSIRDKKLNSEKRLRLVSMFTLDTAVAEYEKLF